MFFKMRINTVLVVSETTIDSAFTHHSTRRRSGLQKPNGSISSATGGRNTVAAYTRRRSLHGHEFARDRLNSLIDSQESLVRSSPSNDEIKKWIEGSRRVVVLTGA